MTGEDGITKFASAVYFYIQARVHGTISCYYNKVRDILEVQISNRALNINSFIHLEPDFSHSFKEGIRSNILAARILDEYRNYVNLYIFKKGGC